MKDLTVASDKRGSITPRRKDNIREYLYLSQWTSCNLCLPSLGRQMKCYKSLPTEQPDENDNEFEITPSQRIKPSFIFIGF